MAPESEDNLRFEIGHVLFIDIVGYSKLLIEEQQKRVRQLTEIVLATTQVREAPNEQLVKLPTGDGMALVFRNSAEEPVRCAQEIARVLKQHPEIAVRMGIHSGPISDVSDVSGRTNIAGAGINVAQRVMDCGDAGHILLSQHVADDLAQYRQWAPLLHDLGECEVKHGVRLHVLNLYTEHLGNPELPEKFRQAKETQTASAMPASEKPARGFRRLMAALIILAVVATGAGFYFVSRRPPANVAPSSIVPAAPAIPEKSIAVLPFENLSSERENAYFAGGVQNEILTDLAKVAELKVISRTSVMQYAAGTARNLKEIGRELGVSYVVEGSVQRESERVRVAAQLIDARTDTHVWAETYDRTVADVFAIQSEIAQKIADQLHSKLSPVEKAAMVEQPTADLTAYHFYTEAEAIFAWGNWEGAEESLAEKVDLLEKAIQRDPNFALAYCALAKAHLDLAGFTDYDGQLDSAKKAVDRALQLRPHLGEAHRELARYYLYKGDLNAAHEASIVALRALPNDSGAFRVAGEIAARQNRWNDALTYLQKAHELDPRNEEVTYHLGVIYRFLRLYRPWEELMAKGFAQHGGWAQLGLAEIKLDQGDLGAAQAILTRIPMDFSPTLEIWDTRYTVALCRRDYAAANRILAAIPANFREDPLTAWWAGLLAQLSGDEPKAKAIALPARKEIDAHWDGSAHGFLVASRLDTLLGRKEIAIEEAKRAVRLMPMTKDAELAPQFVTKAAIVFVLTGQRDLAIDQLEAVAKIPGGPSYGELRFSPVWDPLRGDPRFAALLLEAAKPPKL